MAPTLWIDAHDYSAALLRGGEEPWRRPGEIGLFCAEEAKLLSADRLFLPLGALIALYADCDGGDAMTRAEQFDEAVAGGDVLDAVDTAFASLDGSAMRDRVVPVLPGPAAVAGADDEEALDTAAMALGDMLRAVGEFRPPAVAVAESDPAGLEACGSLFRIAGHIGCPVVLLGPTDHPLAEKCFPAPGISDVGKGDCRTVVLAVPGETETVPVAHLRACVDAGRSPEAVLAAIATLRTTA